MAVLYIPSTLEIQGRERFSKIRFVYIYKHLYIPLNGFFRSVIFSLVAFAPLFSIPQTISGEMPMSQIFTNPDVLSESVIPLNDVVKYLPFQTSIATVQRWIRRGASGAVLETARMGSRRFTSKEAVQRFLVAQNEPVKPQAAPPKSPMSKRDLDAKTRKYFGTEASNQ